MLWDYVMGTFRLHPQDPGSKESLRAPAMDGSEDFAAGRVGKVKSG